MKPIKTKTFLVKQMLFGLSIALTLFGYLMTIKEIPFFPTLKIIMSGAEQNIEIGQGLISISYVSAFLAFICSYLIFEFYGFKSALYTAVLSAGSVFLFYGLIELMHMYVLAPQSSRLDTMISEVFARRLDDTVGFAGGYGIGASLGFFVAATVKVITRNYFMFIRYPIAAVVAMGTFLVINIYITQFQVLAIESMLFLGFPTASQLLAMILVAQIPLYILRLVLGMFRGRSKDDESEPTGGKSKGMFSSKKNSEVITETQAIKEVPVVTAPQKEVVEAVVENSESAKNDDEDDYTVSKKIRFAPN